MHVMEEAEPPHRLLSTNTYYIQTASDSRPLLDLDDGLDLDGHAERQRVGADRGARVPAALAEDVAHEVGAAVDHGGLRGEALGARDEADELVHARSAVGTNALPLGVPVEIEAIVEVKEGS